MNGAGRRERQRPSATVETLVAALETYEKTELAGILAHVINTYVVEGISPNSTELGIIDFPRHLRELDFVQLVSHLKMHLDLPQLDLFSINAGEVFVKVAGRDYSLTNAQAAPPPPAVASAEPAQAPPRQAGTPPNVAAPPPEPAEAPKDVELSDRFRMLELD